MRKALTLVEMIVVISVLPPAMMALSWFFATFIRDIPRMTRVVERNTTVFDVLQQLRVDMDRATALPDTFGTVHCDERILLLKVPEHVICYELSDGCVRRSVLEGDRVDCPEPRVWKLPETEIVWSRWQENDKAYAVEVHSHIRQKEGKQVKAKLANSYVFFVHGLGKDGLSW